MNGEKLNREYHELLGWKARDSEYRPWDPPPDRADEGCELPELHSDANLCIAELDRVFKRWQSWSDDGGTDRVVIQGGTEVVGRGATFNEAALKALIAARTK